METLVKIIHVMVCIFLMLTVLLQAGKGGGMGSAFGGGSSSGSVFGGSGAGNFLKKLTVGAAILFVATSMSLAYLASSTGSDTLKAYSAQQRRNAELKRQQHEAALDVGAGAVDGDDAPLDGKDAPVDGDDAAAGDDATDVDAPPRAGDL